MSKANQPSSDQKAATDAPVRSNPLGNMGNFGNRGGVKAKPKNFKGTIGRLWTYFGKERKLLTIIFLLITVDAVITLSVPYLMGLAIDAMSTASGLFNLKLLEIVILALVAAYIVDGALSFLQSWLMAGVSQRIVANLRHKLFAKLQKLPLGYFDSRSHGEVMSRLTNDMDNVSNSISQSTTQLMSSSIVIVGSLVMMLVLSPLLTLASLITLPLVILLARTITKRTSLLFKAQQDQLGKLNGHIEETISGILIIQAFNHEAKAIEEFNEVNDQLCEVGLKAQIWSGYLMPLLGVINNIGFAAVAIVGGVLAINGHITVGVIASFLSYSRQFVRPLTDIANTYNVLQSGVAGAERVFEVMDEDEEIVDAPGAIVLNNPRGHVVFENASFSYRPDVPILQNVSFDSAAASSSAFVGPTGAGKTTIVNLLTRFYDVTSGAIYIDGINIKQYTRDSLRKCFGIVLQDTYLFSGTIMENIQYGKSDATQAEVEAAAQLANADTFIKRLPQQYETMLTENGGNLSQGQRQLLAIARVILAKPSILILDEATSSIDTRTELHIQDALLKIMHGRTSFIIAHRLNTIRDADSIMVIDHGEIVEKGSHEQLLAAEGSYYRMFSNQFKNMQGALE
jgi:ATP-binding cassette subfamily B multidrug efflux pump